MFSQEIAKKGVFFIPIDCILQVTGKINMKQDCIPVGCVPPARWPYLPACSVGGAGGLLPGVGGLLLGGVCSGGVCSGGCLLLGGSALGGVSQHALRQTPPPCEQNHTRLWKRNLAPTSLRVVMIVRLTDSRVRLREDTIDLSNDYWTDSSSYAPIDIH